MPKKTLITKLSLDCAEASEAQIEVMKTFLRVSFAPAGFTAIDFEIVEETEQTLADQVERLLQSVRSEFRENDAPEGSDEQH